MTLLTGASRGAGTDSGVNYQLRGSRGSSGPIAAVAGRDAFQRGGADTFAHRLPALGQLQQVAVWIDGAGGERAPWQLEAVVVRCRRDGSVTTFPCGAWLSQATQLRVELVPGAGAPARARCDRVGSRRAGVMECIVEHACQAGPASASCTCFGAACMLTPVLPRCSCPWMHAAGTALTW